MTTSISTDTTVTTVVVTKKHEDDMVDSHADVVDVAPVKARTVTEEALNDAATLAIAAAAETSAEASKVPAWEQFLAALSLAEHPEIKVEERKGWVKLEGKNGHKIYVAKQTDEVKLVETTLEVSGLDGTLPLPKPNGRIDCRLVPTPDNVAQFLSLLVSGDAIRAPKRMTKST